VTERVDDEHDVVESHTPSNSGVSGSGDEEDVNGEGLEPGAVAAWPQSPPLLTSTASPVPSSP
jgi:hypothetical protein